MSDMPSPRSTWSSPPSVESASEVYSGPPPWLVLFYAELIVTGSVRKAVAAAGISFEEAWRWRRGSPDFAEYWDRSIAVYRSRALIALVAGPASGERLQ